MDCAKQRLASILNGMKGNAEIYRFEKERGGDETEIQHEKKSSEERLAEHPDADEEFTTLKNTAIYCVACLMAAVITPFLVLGWLMAIFKDKIRGHWRGTRGGKGLLLDRVEEDNIHPSECIENTGEQSLILVKPVMDARPSLF